MVTYKKTILVAFVILLILSGLFYFRYQVYYSHETLTLPPENVVKITFPEGWDSQKMAKRLTENGLGEEGFWEIVKNPGDLKEQFNFLKDGTVKSLEGYLFPDTYFFKKDESARSIVFKMLSNFEGKITSEMKSEIEKQKRSLEEVIILASIVEKEVNNTEDRKIASGIFLNRIKNGQALQSCATLAYILGINKKQYSYADTRVKSPYNTYLNPGLPPGPISNPGIDSIEAAIYPQDSEYNYFLSDPETGKTYYAKTIAEHNANKERFGL